MGTTVSSLFARDALNRLLTNVVYDTKPGSGFRPIPVPAENTVVYDAGRNAWFRSDTSRMEYLA